MDSGSLNWFPITPRLRFWLYFRIQGFLEKVTVIGSDSNACRRPMEGFAAINYYINQCLSL